MEMTGSLGLHVPLLIMAVTASGVSKLLGRSIYDEMIELKGYKSLPSLAVLSFDVTDECIDLQQTDIGRYSPS